MHSCEKVDGWLEGVLVILTVTLNSAIDKVLLLNELIPGKSMSCHGEIISVGGKGLDSSVVLRHIGVETVGLAFVSGDTGLLLETLVQKYGIVSDFIWVGGDTRLIYVLAEAKNKRVSHIKQGGLQIEKAHLAKFLENYHSRLAESEWVICSGSLPDMVPLDFYGELARRAKDKGIPFLLDSMGDGLLAAIPFNPTILKLNWEEFETTFGVHASTLDKLTTRAIEVTQEYRINSLVLTCSDNGVLAVTPSGVYHAFAPIQEVVNPAGAGDAVSSSIAWRLSLGDPWKEALRWAAACGAAVVLTPGTADCHWDDVVKIYSKVEVYEPQKR